MLSKTTSVRHGRSLLVGPVQKYCYRSLMTESEATHVPAQSDPPALDTPPKTSYSQLKLASRWAPASKRKGPSNYVVLKTAAIKTTTKKTTASLGAVISHQYHPNEAIWNPPKPEDVTLEMLMAAQTHLGHHTSLWNPMNQQYIYGIRQGVHIISLEATAAYLRRAAKIVEAVCYHGGIVLFVGTKKGHRSAVVKASELTMGCHIFERWQPGTITNGDQILRSCRIKVLDSLDRPIEVDEDKLEGLKALRPDLVVCLNPLENYIMLHECGTNNIPTIGVIDTNADPSWVTYPIPANDDSVRSAQVISGVLGRAGEAGRMRRLTEAKTGKISWSPSSEISKLLDKAPDKTDNVINIQGQKANSTNQVKDTFVEPIRDPEWRIKMKDDNDEL
ncbi:BgTH12-01572 [Blumeria graminis f. sp. triticale]|uniref:BgTH12-01572 n=1 Tax=Blumeria graminis f. sp. triticale TaxID=1689686 RepID=A0A9W4GEY2_BLUGR|nr:BgTH12-01572 [Blumeria graminis f. sp. triticale]